MDSPEVHILHKSDFYQIRNYKCNCTKCHTSPAEFTALFNFCFVRSGYFEYHIFRRKLEVHIGRVMISKPGCEHITRHIENQPDICTAFDFTSDFYQSIKENYEREAGWFFRDNDRQSVLLNCPPELDYLHQLIVQQTGNGSFDTLLLDDWVVRLVDKVMRVLGNRPSLAPLSSGLKKYHLSTIEKAKDYLISHFSENISLQKVAEHCCVSVFHFCRIFKSIMKVTPYQYVNEIRLHHARLLLENSRQSITHVAFQCGFNSVERFDHAYRQHFNTTPSAFRKRLNF